MSCVRSSLSQLPYQVNFERLHVTAASLLSFREWRKLIIARSARAGIGLRAAGHEKQYLRWRETGRNNIFTPISLFHLRLLLYLMCTYYPQKNIFNIGYGIRIRSASTIHSFYPRIFNSIFSDRINRRDSMRSYAKTPSAFEISVIPLRQLRVIDARSSSSL